jgi:WD40 repeat protein
MRLASGSGDDSIICWDLRTGRNRRIKAAHTPVVSCLSYVREGKTLASGGNDGFVKVWNVETDEARAVLRTDALSINSIAFDPFRKMLAAAGTTGAAYLWRFYETAGEKKAISRAN